MNLTATPIAFQPPLAPARLGEGSLWDDRHDCLLWVDISARLFHRYFPVHGRLLTLTLDEDAGTVVPRESGGWVLALRSKIVSVAEDGQTVTTLLTHVQPGQRFNDGKCDPAGRLWVGSYGEKWGGDGVFYRLGTDHRLTRMFDGVVCSNGLVWTHDRRTLYYIDSGTGRVDAFDYDEASGGISNRRPAISFPKDQGVPDGMTIDAEGKLWVAIFNGKAKGGEGRVLYCDPVQGTVQGQVRVPGAGAVTSCAFGGPKMDELFITTASVHLQPETAGEQPHAGRLFRVKTPTHGLKAYRYKG